MTEMTAERDLKQLIAVQDALVDAYGEGLKPGVIAALDGLLLEAEQAAVERCAQIADTYASIEGIGQKIAESIRASGKEDSDEG